MRVIDKQKEIFLFVVGLPLGTAVIENSSLSAIGGYLSTRYLNNPAGPRVARELSGQSSPGRAFR